MANQPAFLRATKYFAIFLVLFLCPLCFAESIVVQVLNAKDGRPIPGQTATVELHYVKPAFTVTRIQKTDSHGEAWILLPPDMPETMHVSVSLNPTYMHCSCRLLANTETVMRQGIMVASPIHDAKSPAPVQPAPGHIVFVAHPFSLLQRALYGY